MRYPEVKRRVTAAVKAFVRNEAFLLENDLNERTATHKLAIYIEREFKGYDVDCEYNKMWKGSESVFKSILPEAIKSDDTKAITVYPDIIIHNRNDSSNNLLVIEVKKESTESGDAVNKDMEKIKTYCKGDLKYKHGLFLILKNKPEYQWFTNGHWV